MDFILGINKRIIFKQKSLRGIVAIINLANEWVCMIFIIWLNDEVTYIVFSCCFFFFFTVERGGREITSWQLQTPTDSLTWHITTAKKTTPIQHRCSWAQKANVIRCESRSHANQAKVIHVEGLTLCCQKCFWYQPPRNASSPANLALSCKTNIKVGTGEDSC